MEEMIGSFASERGRPAIFLPEQAEVLAHWVFWSILFFRSLQILALLRLPEGKIFTLWSVAEVLAGRKSICGYFWPRDVLNL
jgi:hypothetical protein